MREGISVAFEIHEIERIGDQRVALLFHKLLVAQAKVDVLANGFPRKQGKVLEHDGTVRSRTTDRSCIDTDGARRRLFEACDNTQASRLAAARRADNGDELLVRNLKVDVVKH